MSDNSAIVMLAPELRAASAHGPGGHDHGHGHLHVHAALAEEDTDPAWLDLREAYAGLRTSLQLLAGLQLMGVGAAEITDLRKAVLVRVRLLLDEVLDRLNTITVPRGTRPLTNELVICLDALTLAAARQGRELSDRTNPGHRLTTQRLLEQAADRLRRCQRYDRGLRFFGSGGCADIEHALSHLRPEGSFHG